MNSTAVADAVEAFSQMLSTTIEVTSVPTTLSIPLSSINSALQSAMSFQQLELSSQATITDTAVAISLEQRILLAQATINYYSVLSSIATATSTSAADMTQAAQASAIMQTMFAEVAYFEGHAPSFTGNLALIAVFSVILVFQIVFGVFFHQWWFCFSWSIGLVMELFGYAGRVWCHSDLLSFDAFVMQLVCITLAPCFLLAGMYYTLAQLAHIYGEQHSVLRPMIYSYAFIIGDFISICLQGAGGGMSSSPGSLYDAGINIMIGGLAFQVLTMTIFQYLWFTFLFRIHKSYKQHGDSNFNPDFVHIRERGLFLQLSFFVAITATFFLVYVRSIYRLIEMSYGFDSALATNEIYFMLLEALPMSLACAIMTVVHPGLIYGRGSHIYIDKNYRGFFPIKEEAPVEKKDSNSEYELYSFIDGYNKRETL